ncbi:MAG: alpha/beta hydrolase [Burkholderiaceae bacterium]|nr:alpha/beta hydrolase [Burkholderiaceae bacterium]
MPYVPRLDFIARQLPIRGLSYQLLQWGQPRPGEPLLVMMHGWMDVAASFQFVVDALQSTPLAGRCIVAADWRGFGGSQAPAGTDAYWFQDYCGDLDALLDALSPEAPVDLLGHSMGGNVVMTYAGVRPQRIRRLVNLEGFGLPDLPADKAPARLAQWLDELKTPQTLRPYASRDEVAQRLQRNNPRLAPERAAWLAGHWAAEQADGRWALQADAAHRRVNPVPYRAAEALAFWRAIRAPLLWVQGAASRPEDHWQGRYSLAEFETRLAQVADVRRVLLEDAGHMLHHDQPEALAQALADFLSP